jgi:hypothetical protein
MEDYIRLVKDKEYKKTCKILVGKPLEYRLLGRPRRRWEGTTSIMIL